MLSSKRRIAKDQFARILKEGRSFHSPDLSLKVLSKDDPAQETSFSFVVSAKISPLASKRNFLKRRGRHAVKRVLNRVKNGYYCVFFFKKSLIGLPFPQFGEEIENSLRGAGLLK